MRRKSVHAVAAVLWAVLGGALLVPGEPGDPAHDAGAHDDRRRPAHTDSAVDRDGGERT